MLKFSAIYLPKTGRIRSEDAILFDRRVLHNSTARPELIDISTNEIYTLAVFDGLGAHPRSRTAAVYSACRLRRDIIDWRDQGLAADQISNSISTSLHGIHNHLLTASRASSAIRPMGAAVCTASVTPGGIVVKTAGDVALLHRTHSTLDLLTTLHRTPLGGLTQCLGGDYDEPLILSEDRLTKTEGLFILASDGFWEHPVVASTLRSFPWRVCPQIAALTFFDILEQNARPDDASAIFFVVK